MATGSSAHNTKFAISPYRMRGSVLLAQDIVIKISAAVYRKNKTMIHLASGNVYISDNATTLASPTDGWKVPTGIILPFMDEDDIYAVTTDSEATIYVWDE